MQLIRLAYISTAVQPFTPEDAEWVAGQALPWFRENEVTGMLLYANDTFLHILEGRRTRLHELLEIIKLSDKHIWYERIFEAEIAARMFRDWSMGTCDFTKHHGAIREEFRAVRLFLDACDTYDPDAVTRGLIRRFETQIRVPA